MDFQSNIATYSPARRIRNLHLYHLTMAFGCGNCTSESLFWSNGDLEMLSDRLNDLVARVSALNSASGEGMGVHELV